MSTSFALVDCNNFFVSCERVFQPHLEKKPVIVLSNNDGCVIARSNESKMLGIPMGAPYFQIRALVKQHQIAVFSSNFSLYGDMSERIMNILKRENPNVEIYSIDEAFLDFSGFKDNGIIYAEKLVKQIHTWTGLPISIGIAPTKTLTKIANHFVKKWKPIPSVLDLSDPIIQDIVLSKVDVGEVWGVGRRLKPKLTQLGIKTAEDLKKQDPYVIKRKFNIFLMQTVLELRGQSIIHLDGEPVDQKQIRIARSFSSKLSRLSEIKAALASYVAKASEKLRDQGLIAGALMIFLETNRFSKVDAHYQNTLMLPLALPTNSTTELISEALHGLDHLYREGYQYKKVGVVLLQLNPEEKVQFDLFSGKQPHAEKSARTQNLMQTLDLINSKMGDGALHYGVEGFLRKWQVKPCLRSPSYTTRWDELPIVWAH